VAKKVGILGRLIGGFSLIVFLVLIADIYVIYKIFQLQNISKQIVTDNQIIYFQEKMSEYFLAMLRNERQYIYFRDKAFKKYFEKNQEKFDFYFQKIRDKATDDNIKELLEKVAEIKKAYIALCQREFQAIESQKNTKTLNNIDKQRKEITGEMIQILKNINQYLKEEIKKLAVGLDTQIHTSIQTVIYTLVIVAILIIVMASILAYNITHPLYFIVRYTQEFAKGDFSKRLKIDSPPEIEKLADTLNSMADKLQELDRLKGDFFSIISHDLKHPLASIQESALLLEEEAVGEINDDQKKLIEIILEETRKLIRMIEEIMDLSKLEAGVMKFEFETIDLKLLINKVCKDLSPIFMRNHIKLKIDMEKDLPTVKVDIKRIEQVLQNLLLNAVKFSPEDSEINLQAKREANGVVVSIKDQGPGIPPENLDHIFEKFVQLYKGSRAKGTGLGLAIVRYIIEAHGGKVWVESKEGEGSTFYFFLPGGS